MSSSMELTSYEKDMLESYLVDFIHAKEIADKLQFALLNLQKMALYARGLSPETYRISSSFIIEEIKKTPI